MRRLISIDGHRPGGIGGPILLSGIARDMWRGKARSTSDCACARFDLRVASEDAFEIEVMASEPERAGLQTMVGTSARHGLRKRLAASGSAQGPDGRLLEALLDDIPVTVSLSRLALLYRDAFHPDGSQADGALTIRAPALNVCAGWRSGSFMRRVVEAGGSSLLQEGVLVDEDEDDAAWPARLQSDGFRRRRRLDVAVDSGGEVSIVATFRDTYADQDGNERIQHEYECRALASAPDGTIVECYAIPRVLPAADCAHAAASASSLVGEPLSQIDRIVRERFLGPSTCTHLNDAFVGLSGASALAQMLERHREE